MDADTPQRRMLSLLPMLALSACAMLMIGAGVAGLWLPDKVPQLAHPVLAWGLVGAGIVIDVIAGVMIVLALRRDDQAPAGRSNRNSRT